MANIGKAISVVREIRGEGGGSAKLAKSENVLTSEHLMSSTFLYLLMEEKP